MFEIAILCGAALVTSLLTFFSGFGLGTILMPVFAIFLPLDIAVALTGAVHFLNNIFKLGLVGLRADKTVVLHFGIPAFFASLVGAYLLLQLSDLRPIYRYELWNREYSITPVKLIISLILIFFTTTEVIPFFKKLQFGKDKLVLGGLLSGFFGGLSGNQGALRSAFLIKSDLSKEAFIATGIVIACIVDVSRLGVYLTRFSQSRLQGSVTLVIAATFSAFIGAYLGSRLLKRVTHQSIQMVVMVMLFILSIALGLGIV